MRTVTAADRPLSRVLARLSVIALFGCGSAEHAEHAEHDHGVEALDDDFKGCPEGIAAFEPGRTVESEHFSVTVLGATPSQPERYENSWTLQLDTRDGTPVTDLEIVRGQTFMPVHGHDGRVEPEPLMLAEPGRFEVDRLHFTMRGPWEVRLWLSSALAAVTDELVVIHVCVAR